jgi:hypothetical protein
MSICTCEAKSLEALCAVVHSTLVYQAAVKSQQVCHWCEGCPCVANVSFVTE